MKPFYDYNLTYEDNYNLCNTSLNEITDNSGIIIPFGIPAGPLLNGNYCSAAFNAGYDICVYKTVRAGYHPCNEFPNVLFVHPKAYDLSFAQADKGVIADNTLPSNSQELNISNSFGVPSFDPDIWQEDMKKALQSAKKGQTLVGSFQGLNSFESFVTAAKLVAETGVKHLELNTSCPNEGKDSLLCFDPKMVGEITEAIKNEVGDLHLSIKIGYLRKRDSEAIDYKLLDELLSETISKGRIQGISAINTIPAKLINSAGVSALPGVGRETAGVCGAGIKWAGLEMVKALNTKRDELIASGLIKSASDFAITGVGGVMNYEDYLEYRKFGADEVLAATGPMFKPDLAIQIKNKIIFSGTDN